MSGTLTIKTQTVFKQDPTKQAGQLGDSQKTTSIQANQTFDYDYIAIRDYNGKSFDDHKHLEVHFSPKIPSAQGDAISTWFVYANHVKEIR